VHVRPAYLGLVFLGGMAGTITRFGLAEVLPVPGGLPLGIFLINVAGAFALGLLLEALARRGPDEGRRRALRLLLGTGFLGGFTTYSALTVDSVLLVDAGRPVEAAVYVACSVLVGLTATAAGIAAGHSMGRGPGPEAGPAAGPTPGITP
jgi:CrcB protein